MPSKTISVLIADDHRLFAESLRALLCEDERVEVVGIAGAATRPCVWRLSCYLMSS